MDGQLDISVIVLAVGGAVTAVVNLSKMGGLASTPARTVAIAFLVSAALVSLYVFLPIGFALAAAAILATASAVGLHEMSKSTTRFNS